MKYTIPLLVVIAGFITMNWLIGMKTDTPKQDPQVEIKVVSTEIVTLAPVASQLSLYGRAATSEPVILNSEVNGVLEEGDIPFKESSRFRKGDLLFKVDDRQARLSLNTAKSDLLNSLANVLPEIQLDFEQEYIAWQEYFNGCGFNSRIAPLPDVTNDRIHLYLSRFNVYKNYYNLLNLEIILDKHYFYAPFDGSITKANLQVGSSVRIGSQIGEIINLTDMEIAVPVDINNIAWIGKDTKVTIESVEFSKQWSGTITRVGSNIDPRTQTADIYIKVDKNGLGGSDQLLNGLFVQVEFKGRVIENAFEVLPMALYEDSFVYLLKNGTLQKTNVNLVRRESDRVLITEGISTGDVIVVEALQGVASGMPARSKSDQPGDI